MRAVVEEKTQFIAVINIMTLIKRWFRHWCWRAGQNSYC